MGAGRGVPLVLQGILALAAVPPLFAQTNERLYEEFDFRFVTPGARATAMGNAFVGLADDATAAYSNPAGLSNLLDSEVSVEFTATDIRHYRLVTTEPEPRTEAFGEHVVTPSFFSLALPIERHTLSFFTNRIQDYRETFVIERREGSDIPGFDQSAFGSTAIQLDNYGIGWSFVVSRHVSIGLSGVLATLDLASRIRNGQPLNPRNGTDTLDSDSEVTGILGLVIKPSRTLSFGAAYHRGASFDLETTFFGRFLYNDEDVFMTGTTAPMEYVVPDKFTIGVAARPWTESLVLLLDVAHIKYSQIVTDGFLIVDFMDPAAELSADNFFVDDVTEVYLGGEYRFFWNAATIGLRAGGYTDTDHPLQYIPQNNDHPADPFMINRFNTVDIETDIGWSLGAGAAWSRVQFDAAWSEVRDASKLVISAVVRVG